MLIWLGTPQAGTGVRIPCGEFAWTLLTLAVFLLTGWLLPR